MKEPVITPSGITYDRKDIEQHLQVRKDDFNSSRIHSLAWCVAFVLLLFQEILKPEEH